MAVHMRQPGRNEHAYDAFVRDHSDIARRQPTKNAGVTLLVLQSLLTEVFFVNIYMEDLTSREEKSSESKSQKRADRQRRRAERRILR